MPLTHSTVLKNTTGQMLACLGAILKKGAAHAESLKTPDAVFLDFRLYPDMFPLSRQVQIACDNACRGAARLAGVQLPSFPDTEASFAQLIERTQKANAYVLGFILPNVYFHAATAYDILRHNGAPLGKSDFLRPPA